MARRRALLPLDQLPLLGSREERWVVPPLNLKTAGDAPAVLDVVIVNAFPSAIWPSMLTVQPLAPKIIGRDAPPASVHPAPEISFNSACPPAVAALMLNAPPLPSSVGPVAVRPRSLSLEK